MRNKNGATHDDALPLSGPVRFSLGFDTISRPNQVEIMPAFDTISRPKQVEIVPGFGTISRPK